MIVLRLTEGCVIAAKPRGQERISEAPRPRAWRFANSVDIEEPQGSGDLARVSRPVRTLSRGERMAHGQGGAMQPCYQPHRRPEARRLLTEDTAPRDLYRIDGPRPARGDLNATDESIGNAGKTFTEFGDALCQRTLEG
jgi:hypothetical protein